jgi:hypothetical protein
MKIPYTDDIGGDIGPFPFTPDEEKYSPTLFTIL